MYMHHILLVDSSVNEPLGACLHLFAVENNAAITCMFQYLFKTFLSLLLSLYSEVELLGHMIIPSLTFQSNHQVDFHSSCTISHSYQR